MGSDVTKGGVEFQLRDKFRPIAKLQRYCLDTGSDPKGVDLNVLAKDLRGHEIGGQKATFILFLRNIAQHVFFNFHNLKKHPS